jgi:hypothetical protein
VGSGHAVHDVVPQEFVLLFWLQSPLQLWLPVGHWLLHARPASMHAPWQSCLPEGHVPPHEPLVHVAWPPVGTAHGVHEDPQLPTSVLLRHLSLQRW